MRWNLLQTPKKVAILGKKEEPWIFRGQQQSPEDRAGKVNGEQAEIQQTKQAQHSMAFGLASQHG